MNPNQKTTIKNHFEVLGKLWMPSTEAAQIITLDGKFKTLEEAYDKMSLRTGDFQKVLDYRWTEVTSIVTRKTTCQVDHVTTRTRVRVRKDWKSPDNQSLFNDCWYGPEEEEAEVC